jgi:PKHD-type hydroxylase
MNNLDKIEEPLQLDNAMSDYYVYNRAVPKETCDQIIKFAEGQWEDASVGGENVTQKNVRKEIRDSQVAWSSCPNLFEMVWGYLNDANDKAMWRFQIDSAQPMQITKYQVGGFYEFHKDGNGFTRDVSDKNIVTYNKTRKLSMTVVLNDDYEGGEFEFLGNGKIKEKMGTVIVFPSYMQHRVLPVTKGVRYSLVVWFCGEPFI